ncbi:annexin-2 receptor-like [Hippopotamus amphibius kiboko]|uniref:annexin-2 receptor-like n=1 Tax=Hippopotamus amphibius kiboko TaxID=575201 RepID=UPI0025941313|nr:annexin-2 receptor-like [Hippopotamus amphibius kiboko]
MAQPFPACERRAWDSARKAREPKMPSAPSSADSVPWHLPFYPSLCELSWDGPDFDWEMLSSPCGILRWDCSRNGHLAGGRSPSRRDAEPPALDPRPETHPDPEAPPGEAAAASAASHGRWHGFLDRRAEPEDADGGEPTERRPAPAPGSHCRSQGWWQRIRRAVARKTQGC